MSFDIMKEAWRKKGLTMTPEQESYCKMGWDAAIEVCKNRTLGEFQVAVDVPEPVYYEGVTLCDRDCLFFDYRTQEAKCKLGLSRWSDGMLPGPGCPRYNHEA